MKNCSICGKQLYQRNKIGSCRSCLMSERNRDPVFIKRQMSGRVMTPARKEALAKVCEENRVSIPERFARYITGEIEGGCIEWNGAVDRKGYGRITINRRTLAATHVALMLSGRLRPSPGHFALHTCDNPACVNSDHLWWGTQSENMKDCFSKGRCHVRGLEIGWRRGPRDQGFPIREVTL